MNEDWFQLTKGNIYFLFFYNLFFLFVGIILSLAVLADLSLVECYTITSKAIIGGIGFSLIGSTIYYSRKLYKSCINDLIKQPDSKNNNYSLGVLFYFTLRPIFAIAFSILTILLIKGSVNIVTVHETRLNESFIYLSLALSFFSGFSAGKYLTGLDSKGGDLIEKLFSKF
ncbi:MAG: hypothetical protein CVV25_14670 [Ignavibacteriae bacterium HGW-Ignavibacteriae-4]|nr:MAG: hypothetical protein CVV25_14670 [Ignavibacteriae bacterium HGW-Ignavibacteriae-4]